MNTKIVEVQGRRRRRRHSAQFKASAIQACQQPEISIAAVALANGLNANMLRKWVIEAERAKPRGDMVPKPVGLDETEALSARPSSFVVLPLEVSTSTTEIQIELQRSGTTVKVSWPVTAAVECGVWLCELLS